MFVLFVEEGRLLRIHISPLEKVIILKQFIEQEYQLPPSGFILLDERGSLLRDESVLSACGCGVESSPIYLFLTRAVDGDRFKLSYPLPSKINAELLLPNDPFEDLKRIKDKISEYGQALRAMDALARDMWSELVHRHHGCLVATAATRHRLTGLQKRLPAAFQKRNAELVLELAPRLPVIRNGLAGLDVGPLLPSSVAQGRTSLLSLLLPPHVDPPNDLDGVFADFTAAHAMITRSQGELEAGVQALLMRVDHVVPPLPTDLLPALQTLITPPLAAIGDFLGQVGQQLPIDGVARGRPLLRQVLPAAEEEIRAKLTELLHVREAHRAQCHAALRTNVELQQHIRALEGATSSRLSEWQEQGGRARARLVMLLSALALADHLVAEIPRRHAFDAEYTLRVSLAQQNVGEYRKTELSARRRFFELHYGALSVLPPALSDLLKDHPPTCLVAPRPFDTSLPKPSAEYLANLSAQIGSLYTSAPELRVLLTPLAATLELSRPSPSILDPSLYSSSSAEPNRPRPLIPALPEQGGQVANPALSLELHNDVFSDSLSAKPPILLSPTPVSPNLEPPSLPPVPFPPARPPTEDGLCTVEQYEADHLLLEAFDATHPGGSGAGPEVDAVVAAQRRRVAMLEAQVLALHRECALLQEKLETLSEEKDLEIAASLERAMTAEELLIATEEKMTRRKKDSVSIANLEVGDMVVFAPWKNKGFAAISRPPVNSFLSPTQLPQIKTKTYNFGRITKMEHITGVKSIPPYELDENKDYYCLDVDFVTDPPLPPTAALSSSSNEQDP